MRPGGVISLGRYGKWWPLGCGDRADAAAPRLDALAADRLRHRLLDGPPRAAAAPDARHRPRALDAAAARGAPAGPALRDELERGVGELHRRLRARHADAVALDLG